MCQINYEHENLRKELNKPPLSDGDLLKHLASKFNVEPSKDLEELIIESGYHRIKASGYYYRNSFRDCLTATGIIDITLFNRFLSSKIKQWIEMIEIAFDNAMLLTLVDRSHKIKSYSNIFNEQNFESINDREKAFQIYKSALLKSRKDINQIEYESILEFFKLVICAQSINH